MLSVRDLQRSFGPRRAVRSVSFAVGAGEVVGLLGPNGAGKTTTLRVIAGYLDPDGGEVTIAGRDAAGDRDAARAEIGYLPESAPLYPEMRARDYLAFRARLKGIPRRRAQGAARAALERAGAQGRASSPIGALSRGYRQRVALADALVADPSVLVLDEPTVGLDPVQVRELRRLIAELARERAVVFSSHVLAEVETMATRLVVIDAGRVAAAGSPAEVRERAGVGAAASMEETFLALVGGEEAA